MRIARRQIQTVLGVGMIWLAWSTLLVAEEPYQKFLQKLRDERLYDLALVYLEELESQPGVSAEFKADVELERGLLQYQSAAVLSPRNPQRAGKLDKAERSLRDFLQNKRNHPRRGETRLKLGELLLTRADEAKARAGNDATQDNQEAIKFYDDAHQLFEATIQELASILEQIRGARIDANDKAGIAYRQKVQQDLRQAQLLSAKAVDDRGRSRADGSAAQTADLRQALQMFSALYAKEQHMIGVRNYSLFYRSAIQDKLGMVEDAIDGFQRIADLEAIDVLRPLQTNAIKELVQLLAAQEKFPLAVDRASKWISGLRPDERNTPETIGLQLQLAKTKVAWSEKLKKRDPDDRVASRLLRDVRSELRSMLRVPGDHLEETRQLLSELGVDSASAPNLELPKVKDFAEALAEAQQRIERSETDSLGLAVLREQGKDAEAKAAEEAIDAMQQQALVLLQQALRMFSVQDDRAQLYDVRFRQAYLLLQQERPWDALAVAEFLATSNPGTDKGLRSAAIALKALSDLLLTAGEQEKVRLTAYLEPFAEFLVKTWPQSAEAAAAASALVQLALLNKQWDKADQYLALVPADGDSVQQLRRDAGISFYAAYHEEKQLSGPGSEIAVALRTRALTSLELGTQGLDAQQLDGAVLEALNARIRLLLIAGRTEDAGKLLFNNPISPLGMLAKNPKLVAPKIAMESFRTAIQVVVSQLADGKIESKQAIARTGEFIGRLQKLAADSPDGPKTLNEIFVGLTSDLKEQLGDVENATTRKRLSEALVIVAAEAAKSETFNTRHWAVATILSTADELAADKSSRNLAKKSYADAAEILEGMLAKEKAQPGWIEPAAQELQIRLSLAEASIGLEDFTAAINALAEILTENNGLLDVQATAARCYQAWGDARNTGFHRLAYLGGRPDPKTRVNLIWGWGKIARVVEGKSDYTEQFYEARYELAVSRYKFANGLQDPQQKAAGIRAAEQDVTSTASLYPELGGPAMKKKYDALLKVIQKALGKPPQGLAAIGK